MLMIYSISFRYICYSIKTKISLKDVKMNLVELKQDTLLHRHTLRSVIELW